MIKQACDFCGKEHQKQTNYIKVAFVPYAVPDEYDVPDDVHVCNKSCLLGYVLQEQAIFEFKTP